MHETINLVISTVSTDKAVVMCTQLFYWALNDAELSRPCDALLYTHVYIPYDMKNNAGDDAHFCEKHVKKLISTFILFCSKALYQLLEFDTCDACIL